MVLEVSIAAAYKKAMRDLHHRVLRRYLDEAWHQGRIEILQELIHPEYLNHAPALPDLPRGPAGVGPIIRALRHGFPDLRFEVVQEIHDGDLVALRSILRGTHHGEIFGKAPTGRAFEVEQMQIERFSGGLIIEHWRRTDDSTMAAQLGWSE